MRPSIPLDRGPSYFGSLSDARLSWRRNEGQLVPDPAEKPVRLDERLALRPKEAAAAIGLSERAFRANLAEVPHVRIGGAVLVPIDLLRDWLHNRALLRKAG